MNSRKLLIVTHDYSPAVSPRAFRWSAIAEYWADKGWRVDVVCRSQPGAPAQECLNGVNVYRVGRVRVRRKPTFAAGSVKAESNNTPESATGSRPAIAGSVELQRSKARWVIRWVYDRTWKQLWWPDFAGPWYFSAARQTLRLLEQNDYDGLISSSLPFTDHLVGLRAKRACPRIPWLVDVGDPFCFLTETPLNNSRLYRRLNLRAEQRVFAAADAISVTTEQTRKIYADLFPDSQEQMNVIGPLIRQMGGGDDSPPLFSDDDRIRLAFIGTLYPTIRSPEPLLRVFDRLMQTELRDRLELHFFGPVERCEQFFRPFQSVINRSLFLHGQVSHATARQAMNEADCLVNLGNTTTYQLPSKVVEYANAKKPVLNFARTDEDSSVKFFMGYPACFVVTSDLVDDPQPGQVSKLIEFLSQGPYAHPEVLQAFCSSYQLPAIADAYETLLESAGVCDRPNQKAA